MSEQCCLYVVDFAPEGCSYFPGDIVTVPCAAPCESRQITEPGPCQGMILIALAPDCQPCDGSMLSATAALAARGARINGAGTKADRSNAKPLSAAELRALRKVSL